MGRKPMGTGSGPQPGTDRVLFVIVLALFAMKLIPSFLEFRTAKTAIELIAPTAQTPTTRGVLRQPRRDRRHQHDPGEGPRDHARRQPARHRLRLPQGSAAVRPGRTVHRLRGELERPVALLGHSFGRRAAARAGAHAPQPRPGPQRAARVPRRRRARVRGADELYALSAAARGQADAAARAWCAAIRSRAGASRPPDRGAATPTVLADCVEALIGAIFLDGGYPAARRAVVQAFGPLLDADPGKVEKDAKTRLQELMHARGKPASIPRDRHPRRTARAISSRWNASSRMRAPRARGTSRQRAEQDAAKALLESCNERAPLRNDRHWRARPNTGKSSLLNRLVGEKVSIVSKPQTTRHLVTGILTRPTASTSSSMRRDAKAGEKRPAPRLNRRATEARATPMWRFSWWKRCASVPRTAVLDEIPAAQRIVAAVNKVDLVKHASALIPFLDRLSKTRDFAAIVPVSAKTGKNVGELLDGARGAARGAGGVPERPAHRPRRALLRRGAPARENLRGWASDAYRCEVVVDSFKEEGGPGVSRPRSWSSARARSRSCSARAASGSSAWRARRARRWKALRRQGLLGTWVKVRKAWTDDARILRQLGYE